MNTVPDKPAILKPDFAGIPEDMRAERRWVNFTLEYRPDRSEKKPWTKTPKNPRGGNADSTDPGTWGTFEEVKARYEAGGVDGVGFVLGDGWVGVDIDDCVRPDGSMDRYAMDIQDRLPTYGEFSISRSGMHFIAKGKLPVGRRRKETIEMYDSGRYFTVSGDRLGGSLPFVTECTAELAALHADVFTEKPKAPPPSPFTFTAAGPPPKLTDGDILLRARESKSGDKFQKLWDGDTSEHNSDDSAADLALCSHLAFWTGPDQGAIDRLFRQSKLMRDKWDREDYRTRTITKALEGRTDFFGSSNGHANGEANGQAETKTSAAPPPDPITFPLITFDELDQTTDEIEYLIDGILVAAQPGGIFGGKKSLKTNIAIDLAESLATGSRFLNEFPVLRPVRVAMLSGESGQPTIRETARRISVGKGRMLSACKNALIGYRMPNLANAAHLTALETMIRDQALEALVIDPTYLAMNIGDGAANLFVVGGLLIGLTEICNRTKCAPILIHHTKKGVVDPYSPPELEHIAWSGFQEWVRQWLLVGRREPYDPDQGGSHKLWLNVGGSAGHSGLWGLDIDEGTRQDPGGRRWEVRVLKASEARMEARESIEDAKEQEQGRKASAKLVRSRERILAVLAKSTGGETKNGIREKGHINGTDFERGIESLLDDGRVESCHLKKANQTHAAYRLKNSQSDKSDNSVG